MKKRKKTKHYYMHTLEGRPAYFYKGPPGDQICYVRRPDGVAVLVDSLRTIRQQQRRSREFRTRHSWDIPKYGYVRVAVPEQKR